MGLREGRAHKKQHKTPYIIITNHIAIINIYTDYFRYLGYLTKSLGERTALSLFIVYPVVGRGGDEFTNKSQCRFDPPDYHLLSLEKSRSHGLHVCVVMNQKQAVLFRDFVCEILLTI